MDIEYYRTPVPYIIFRNIFTKIVNKRMLDEILSLKEKFVHSGTGGTTRYNPSMRTNTVLFLDAIFKIRKESFFLTTISRLFREDKEFREIVCSTAHPINQFMKTNRHETQVSRYGDEGQRYDWHQDRFVNNSRILSMVYYFWKEPKKWTGGDIQFTDSPIYDGKAIESLIEGKNLATIKPENNMAIVFGGQTAHRVLPTTSPKKFEDGRFSSNIWIGFQ